MDEIGRVEMDGQDQKREAFLDALGKTANSMMRFAEVWESLDDEDRGTVEALDWHWVLTMSLDEMPFAFMRFAERLRSDWGV